MTIATTEQGPQKRYRRLRFPSFDSVVWSEKNPLLQKGELGHEKDTGRIKVGDGVTYWQDLPYAYRAGYTREEVDDIVSSIEEKIPENASAQNQLATKNQITDLQNSKQDIATAVNHNNITNCITKIPQDIQIQTSGETCTLKARSKVYMPNGNGVFNAITISADISNSAAATDAFVVTNGNILVWTNSVFSGTTAPSAPANGTLWYDTANNLVKRFSTSSGSWVSGFSLPIALFNSQDNSKTEIFNGFGYIGSTIFALPGIKGLAPNGRNADGSLRNTEFTTSSVSTQTLTNETFDARPVILRANVLGFNANASYDDKANTLSTGGYMIVGTGSAVGGKITSLSTKTAFHAVDYSDTDFIAHQAMPSDKYVDLTLPATGGTITAPADGYLSFAKAGQTTEYVSLINYKSGISITSSPSVNGNNAKLFMPVSKGDVINLAYTASGATTYFRFVYANGAK